MAANISSHSNLSKKSFKVLIVGHVFQFLLLILITGFPLNGDSTLDVVRNPLLVSKIAATLLLVLHSTLQVYLTTKGTIWRSRSGHNAKILQDFVRCVMLFFLVVTFFYCIAVLFGAAFSEKTAETFHFALLLSSATCAPALIHLGLNTEAWLRVFILNRIVADTHIYGTLKANRVDPDETAPTGAVSSGYTFLANTSGHVTMSPELGTETAVYYTTYCSLAGAWLGAFPIPLDWDRAWQVWPISCVVGTVGGHAAGLLITTALLCRQFYRVHKSKLN